MSANQNLDPNILEEFCCSYGKKLRSYKLSYYIRDADKNCSRENVIHSAIIWSREAIHWINECKEINGNMDANGLFLFIHYVDILLEATTQIYRVLYKEGKGAEEINKKSCFHGKPELYADLSDEKYFKEIRSIFSAHPMNLNTPQKEKRFADFPRPHTERDSIWGLDGDFVVRTWTNTKNDENTLYFSLYIQDLLDYAKSLYSLFPYYEKRLRNIARKKV